MAGSHQHAQPRPGQSNQSPGDEGTGDHALVLVLVLAEACCRSPECPQTVGLEEMRTLLRHYQSSTPKKIWKELGVGMTLATGVERTWSGEGRGGHVAQGRKTGQHLTPAQKGRGGLNFFRDSRWSVQGELPSTHVDLRQKVDFVKLTWAQGHLGAEVLRVAHSQGHTTIDIQIVDWVDSGAALGGRADTGVGAVAVAGRIQVEARRIVTRSRHLSQNQTLALTLTHGDLMLVRILPGPLEHRKEPHLNGSVHNLTHMVN